ncbi:MAG: cytochrome C oxidase subunit IV family protein [Polyangiaceae bacterium]
MSSHAAHAHDDGAVHAHVAPVKFYIGIFAGLILLTFITVAASYFDFGAANTIVAMLIATMKAGLVAAFFMHLTHDKLFNTIAFLSSFVFLGIFIFMTNEDDSHRGRMDEANGTHVLPSKGEVAPGGITNPNLVGVTPEGAAAGGHGATGHGEKPAEAPAHH